MPSQSIIAVQNIKHVALVSLAESSVVAPQLIDSIKRELFALVDEENCKTIVLDLQKVQYLSSSALGVLIPLHGKLQTLKGRLILCSVNSDIMKVFEITKLNKLFIFKNTTSDALAELGVDQPA